MSKGKDGQVSLAWWQVGGVGLSSVADIESKHCQAGMEGDRAKMHPLW